MVGGSLLLCLWGFFLASFASSFVCQETRTSRSSSSWGSIPAEQGRQTNLSTTTIERTRRINENNGWATTADILVPPTTTLLRQRQRQRPTALSAHRWGSSSNSNDNHHNNSQQLQQLQQQPPPNSSTTRSTRNTIRKTTTPTATTKVPFLIETLPRYTSYLVFPEIADMCIQAFFNDDDGEDKNKTMPPWKAVQLSFLRRLQTADLERRRRRQADHNAMLVARRVVIPANNNDNVNVNHVLFATNQSPQPPQQRDSPLILNLDGIVHRELLQGVEDVVRGEILGFVEVTLKPYGLGGPVADADASYANDDAVYEVMDNDANDDDVIMDNGYGYADDETFTTPTPPTLWWNGNTNNGQSSRAPPLLTTTTTTIIVPPPPDRPVLTNLSVRKSARGAGVGSALMAAAEETVRYDWHRHEIVLEVEDDNHTALAFYQKRGYDVLFADKTARRYDVSGLWLQQKRCTRLVLRKDLAATSQQQQQHEYITKPISSVLQKLRDTYRSVVEAR